VSRLAQSGRPSKDVPGPLYLRRARCQITWWTEHRPAERAVRSDSVRTGPCDQTKNPWHDAPLRFRRRYRTLAALHAACFPDAWDAAAIARLLDAPGTFAFHNQDGFVLARTAAGEAEILTLGGAGGAGNRGWAAPLLQSLSFGRRNRERKQCSWKWEPITHMPWRSMRVWICKRDAQGLL